jgi:hypothetical protein
MEGPQTFSGEPVKFTMAPRPLHWVFKVSDLKKSVEILESLGARILRHEEFEEGCEATCNGPYSGWWSKTMVGWENEDKSFVFELTYNYGVLCYERGNDLAAIEMYRHNSEGVDMYELLKTKFADDVVVDKDDESLLRIINGDFPFRFIEGKAPSVQLIRGISLNAVDYAEATRFWKKVGLV